jgi:hypothetical protein
MMYGIQDMYLAKEYHMVLYYIYMYPARRRLKLKCEGHMHSNTLVTRAIMCSLSGVELEEHRYS